MNTSSGAALRVLSLIGVIALSALMFATTKFWAKWFFGALGYWSVKSAVSLIHHHEPWRMQFFLLFLIALVLCGRFALQDHHSTMAKAALVTLAVTLCFSLVLDSSLPFLGGVVTFALAQLLSGSFNTDPQSR
jgi:hypothetical protein